MKGLGSLGLALQDWVRHTCPDGSACLKQPKEEPSYEPSNSDDTGRIESDDNANSFEHRLAPLSSCI